MILMMNIYENDVVIIKKYHINQLNFYNALLIIKRLSHHNFLRVMSTIILLVSVL